jgi:hypothetical protein
MGILITSQIVIVVIILSLPSPAAERAVEMCEGGNGCGGDCLGANTAPLLCCGRAGEAPMTSLKTMFFL